MSKSASILHVRVQAASGCPGDWRNRVGVIPMRALNARLNGPIDRSRRRARSTAPEGARLRRGAALAGLADAEGVQEIVEVAIAEALVDDAAQDVLARAQPPRQRADREPFFAVGMPLVNLDLQRLQHLLLECRQRSGRRDAGSGSSQLEARIARGSRGLRTRRS